MRLSGRNQQATLYGSMRNSSDTPAAHKPIVLNHSARYSVIIVGAGPTGLTLANLLGAHGIDVLLVERNPATVGEPRAVSIDDESLRTMQAAGLIDRVLSEIVPGYGSEYFSRRGRMFLKVQPTDQPYGYARRNAFQQPILEHQLRQGLSRYPHVTTLFSCNLRDFTETPDSVRAELQGSVSSNVECDYLIGCDGASSGVRTQLGIELKGKSFVEPWLILDLENAAAPSRNTYVFCDPARPFIALPGPNRTRRFEFKLHAHENAEDMLRPEVVSQLLARAGTSPESLLTRKCVYRFHARVAEKWSSRRVFLAGDAAHLSPPFAGQGMNSGVRDAHNLAWKLAYVVTGRLGPNLLDSYEIERRDHVWQMIQLALRMGRIMAPANVFYGWLVQSAFRWLGVWPRVRDYFAQMKYKPQPKFNQGFLIPERHKDRQALVGRLLQQPQVVRADGSRTLLDEVLGPDFALLGRAADIPQLLKLADRVSGPPGMRLIAIAAAGANAEVRDGVEAVLDESGHLLQSLADYHGHALLIRPDHYVAAALSLSNLDHAAKSVERLLAATWPHADAAPVTAVVGEDMRPV